MDPRHQTALRVLSAALLAADPAEAVRRQVRRDGDMLRVAGRTYDLSRYRRVLVIGGGKASVPMAAAVEGILGERLTEGLINTKEGHSARECGVSADFLAPGSRVRVIEAGHPVPDARGQDGASRMAALLRGATADDLVICLISGGGSALMALPAPGVTLADKQATTRALLACGATINEVNTVRKHLSQSKGGSFALLAYPADVVTLILSDVIGSPLDVIASGPTVPDPTTFHQALAVLAAYDLLGKVPPPVRLHIEAGVAGNLDDTPDAGHPAFERTFNLVVADIRVAALAAEQEARRLGFSTLLLSTSVEGEAREIAKFLAAIGREEEETGGPLPRPACLIAGGETTVTVRGQGKGGRNQEMALAAALKIDGLADTVILCSATDGSDGPTDAAGAIVDGSTIRRAREMGLDPAAYLADNNSYAFFNLLGDLIKTGPTNTNVNDLAMVFVF